MLTTKRLGGAALYHEIEAIDYATGEVVIANSGEHDLAWLAPGERPRLRRNGWFCGRDAHCGVCAVLEPRARAGDARRLHAAPRRARRVPLRRRARRADRAAASPRPAPPTAPSASATDRWRRPGRAGRAPASTTTARRRRATSSARGRDRRPAPGHRSGHRMTRGPTAAARCPVSLRDLRDVDPYPAYERLRAVGQGRLGRGDEGVAGLDHDGCAFVERREDLFAEPTGGLPGAAEIVGRRDFRSLVGEQHDGAPPRCRTPGAPSRSSPTRRDAVRPIVADRIAALAAADRFELFQDFARLLPIAVVARMLGLPDADARRSTRRRGGWRRCSRGATRTARIPGLREAAIVGDAAAGARSLLDTVRERRDARRTTRSACSGRPGGDVFPTGTSRT